MHRAAAATALQVGRLEAEAHVAEQARAQFKREHKALLAVLAKPAPHHATAGGDGGAEHHVHAVRAHIQTFADAWATLLAKAHLAIRQDAGDTLYRAWHAAGHLPHGAAYTPKATTEEAMAATLTPRATAIVATTTARVVKALRAALDNAKAAKAELPSAPGEGPYHSPPRAPYEPPGAPNLMTPTQQALQEALTGLYQGWYQLSDGDVWYDLEGGDNGEGFTSRADAIGIAEAGGAWNGGLDDAAGMAADAYGFGVSRTWTTVGDNHVRPAHDDADGQTVQLDEPFTVGGEDLMYPGDPSGSLGNTLGCRCSVDYAVSLPGDSLPLNNGIDSDIELTDE